jgi:hypothetical protein
MLFVATSCKAAHFDLSVDASDEYFPSPFKLEPWSDVDNEFQSKHIAGE